VGGTSLSGTSLDFAQGAIRKQGPRSARSAPGEIDMPTTPTPAPESPRTWRTLLINTPLGWVCSLALAALGIYLLANHGGHIVTALPYLLLLACPLMHLFMHGGHGHHDKRE